MVELGITECGCPILFVHHRLAAECSAQRTDDTLYCQRAACKYTALRSSVLWVKSVVDRMPMPTRYSPIQSGFGESGPMGDRESPGDSAATHAFAEVSAFTFMTKPQK